MNKRFAWPLALLLLSFVLVAVSGCPKKPDPGSDTSGTTDTAIGQPDGADAAAGGDMAGVDTAVGDSAAGGDTAAATDPAAGLPPTAAPAVGSPAPDFKFTTMDGRAMSLGELRGKPVVVNFWATWCGPCKAEFPDFQTSYDANKGKFELISFALSSSEDPSSYIAEQKLGWTFAWDKDDAAADVFKPMVVPLTVFISKEGVITGSVNRKMEKVEFDAELAKIL